MLRCAPVVHEACWLLSHRKRLDAAERPSVGTASSVLQYDRPLTTCQYLIWIFFPLVSFGFCAKDANAGANGGYNARCFFASSFVPPLPRLPSQRSVPRPARTRCRSHPGSAITAVRGQRTSDCLSHRTNGTLIPLSRMTEMAGEARRDSRRDKNTQHELMRLPRQSVYSRLAGYEHTNEAERLAVDPAMPQVVGGGPEIVRRRRPVRYVTSRRRF